MIDQRLSDGEHAGVQSLFDVYNQQYLEGWLPHYKVLVTDKYRHSQCFRRERKIYINPAGDVRVDLLHEMVHAAVGYWHGKVSRKEVGRLVELGAPLQKDLEGYAAHVDTSKDVLQDFFDAGLYAPENYTWSQIRSEKGYDFGLTDKYGKAVSRRSSAFLRRARREWPRGRSSSGIDEFAKLKQMADSRISNSSV